MASDARQKMRDLENRYSQSAHGAPAPARQNSRLNQSHHAGDNMSKIRVRPAMAKQASARPGMAKQPSARPAMAKAASARPGMAKQASARPGVAKQTSAPVMAKQASKTAVKATKLTKEKSKKKLEKGKSKKALNKEASKAELTKEKSKKKLEKGKSKKELKKEQSQKGELSKQPSTLNRTASKANLERTPSRGDLNRTPSRGDLNRTPSRTEMLKRQGSKQSFKKRPSVSRTNSSDSVQLAEFQARRRNWKKFKKMEEKPKKSLVVIWLLVLAELSFDLGTTIIAFQAMFKEDTCCSQPMNLGPLPLSVATPFIFLIVLELLILVRAMVLTMWPSILDHQKEDDDENTTNRTGWRLCACNCFKFSVKSLLRIIHVLVLLNPFFGCIIAWMLLYQSDKAESFLVLGLEGGSIILHFISIKLEGSVRNFRQFIFHCMPLIPFLATVILTLVYLKQEGVCYIVSQAVFQFQGCEICPNGFPPIDGKCVLDNGTVVEITDGGFLDLSDSVLNNPGALTKATAQQGTFCGTEHDGWPNTTAFCFYGYDGDD